MTDYGNAQISIIPSARADSYSYNWININVGGGSVPTLQRTTPSGNATYLDNAPGGVAVWDGTNWVKPGWVYDTGTAAWVPYSQVFDGTTWVG